MSDTLIAPVTTDPELDEDDPIFAHIVKAKDGKTANEIIMEARVFGTPVEALCGHVWVPSRDPERHPLCSKCEEVWKTEQHG